MAYTPTEWATGDVITAQKLNKMEQGIAGAGLQLYGPYFATKDITVPAGQGGPVACHAMEDENGISVTYPPITADAIVMVTAAKITGGAIMTGFAGPSVIYTDDVPAWSDGVVYVYNSDAEQSSDVTVDMTFYSTVEFPQES